MTFGIQTLIYSLGAENAVNSSDAEQPPRKKAAADTQDEKSQELAEKMQQQNNDFFIVYDKISSTMTKDDCIAVLEALNQFVPEYYPDVKLTKLKYYIKYFSIKKIDFLNGNFLFFRF